MYMNTHVTITSVLTTPSTSQIRLHVNVIFSLQKIFNLDSLKSIQPKMSTDIGITSSSEDKWVRDNNLGISE